MSSEWYYIDASGGQAGPVTEAQLGQLFQSNQVHENTFCWSADLSDWMPISQAPGMFSI